MPMTSRKKSRCGICNKEFDSRNFKRHMKIHLKKANETSISYCKICNDAFTAELLAKHVCTNMIIDPQTMDIPTNESKIIKKLKQKKSDLKEIESLPSEDLKILSTNINELMIENKQNTSSLNLEMLKPWQQSIIDYMTPINYNNREICVLWDEIGGIGKTTLKKYLETYEFCITISGSDKNSLYSGYQKLLKNLSEQYWNVIIDLPRSTAKLPDFIEQIKDGNYPSYNYYKTPLKISNASIFVFINNLQLLINLSIDRIKLFVVENNMLISKNIRLHKNRIELTTGTINKPIFSHKRKNYCDNLKCSSDCKICLNFMCKICNRCMECNMCICKNYCNLCNKYFSTISNLNKHKKLHHDIKICLICNNPSQIFICANCVKGPEILKIKCAYCTNYVLPNEMYNHIWQNHIEHVITPFIQFDMCM